VVCDQNFSRRVEIQPQLQPALLRLSAMISQFFIRFRAIALMIMSVGLDCGFEFEKGQQLLICGGSGARRGGPCVPLACI